MMGAIVHERRCGVSVLRRRAVTRRNEGRLTAANAEQVAGEVLVPAWGWLEESDLGAS